MSNPIRNGNGNGAHLRSNGVHHPHSLPPVASGSGSPQGKAPTPSAPAALEAGPAPEPDPFAVAPAVCPKCGGVGYFLYDVPVGDPNFGVLMTCGCKQTSKDRRAAADRLRISNLAAFSDKTFETFDARVRGTADAYQAALDYTQTFQGWLVLFGNCGCGKTHLAAAIGNRALQRDIPVIFTVVPDLLDHLRSTFGPSSDVAYDERFETIRSVPLLILDDLGTENTTAWAREKLFQIINHRYNHRLPTIITLNRKLEEIEPRIVSRISDLSLHDGIVSMPAADYRQHGARASRRRRP